MSSADEIEVNVDEKGADSAPAPATENGLAENGVSHEDAVKEKKATSDGEDDDVVVPMTEKTIESKPERARKTILSEMCDHSKPTTKPPSFQASLGTQPNLSRPKSWPFILDKNL